MTNKMKHLASASVLVVAVMAASPAFAAGTTAGSTITNTATISYSVGGVSQTAINASNSFTVDRKINLTVAEVGTVATTVVPGAGPATTPTATPAVTTFTVTNNSNAVLDFKLTAANLATGTAAPAGHTETATDAFDATIAGIYVDTNGNGTYDAGTDTALTYIDELAADASKTIFVVSSIPTTVTNGQIAVVSLTALAEAGGGTGAEGGALTETTGANTAGMDTVFADVAGTDDAARDAKHSARDDYLVSAPTLSVSKISWVIDDPLNGTTNPKLIPGATVGYCIIISNAAGSAAASNVAISDPLPSQTTYVASSVLLGGSTVGTPTPTSCTGGSTSTATQSAGTVSSGTITSIAAGASQVLWFKATIN